MVQVYSLDRQHISVRFSFSFLSSIIFNLSRVITLNHVYIQNVSLYCLYSPAPNICTYIDKNHTLYLFHRFCLALQLLSDCRWSCYLGFFWNFLIRKLTTSHVHAKKEHGVYHFGHSPWLHLNFQLIQFMSIPIAA